jgi:heme-degrading monooxygenase HmoA
MWARVSTYELAGQDLEEAIRGFERAVAQLRGMEGASDAYLLVDRGSGRALTVTLWESEEALAASEDAADRLRREASGDRVQSVDRYEVAFHQSFR